DERYRYHHLFGEMLRSQLDAGDEADLNLRASAWYEAQGDRERAIDHAIAAGDVSRAGELLWRVAPEVLGRGRIATMRAWLDELGSDQIASSGTLALAAAHCSIADGDGDRTVEWMRVAEGLARDSASPDSFRGEVHLIKATCGLDGVRQMGEDAE